MKLIDGAKPCYKGNTHAHTTRSDGRKTPQELMRLYRDHGYDFLAVTDHWHSMPPQDFEGMLVITGEEFDFNFADQVLHIVGIFPDDAAAQGFDRSMDYWQVIAKINASGGAAIAAHPAWSLNTPDFLLSLEGICAAEVYNTFSGLPWNAPRADASAVLDLVATAGKAIPQIAADDSHFYTGEACVSFSMLQADELSSEGVITALKRGSFYASQGPLIYDAELTDTRLILRTSPVCQCSFISNLVWVDDRCRSGKDMTEHIYELRRDAGETYIRCEIMDEQGRRAWLSPVKL